MLSDKITLYKLEYLYIQVKLTVKQKLNKILSLNLLIDGPIRAKVIKKNCFIYLINVSLKNFQAKQSNSIT